MRPCSQASTDVVHHPYGLRFPTWNRCALLPQAKPSPDPLLDAEVRSQQLGPHCNEDERLVVFIVRAKHRKDAYRR